MAYDRTECRRKMERALVKGGPVFHKGDSLRDVCRILSQKSSIAVCLTSPVGSVLPEDVVLTDKEVHLGEVVDRVAGMIPGSIMTGSEGGVMLCVQTDTASEKEFGRVIDKLDFKGALSEFLHMCPGVAECSLSYGGSAPTLRFSSQRESGCLFDKYCWRLLQVCICR